MVRVLEPGGPRRLDLAAWGLIPYWAKEPRIGNRMINARAESVAEKPAFSRASRRSAAWWPPTASTNGRRRGRSSSPS